MDRIAFARRFSDDDRTLNYKDTEGDFPDYAMRDEESFALGFGSAVFGACSLSRTRERGGISPFFWKTHVEQKFQAYRSYGVTPTAELTERVLLT